MGREFYKPKTGKQPDSFSGQGRDLKTKLNVKTKCASGAIIGKRLLFWIQPHEPPCPRQDRAGSGKKEVGSCSCRSATSQWMTSLTWLNQIHFLHRRPSCGGGGGAILQGQSAQACEDQRFPLWLLVSERRLWHRDQLKCVFWTGPVYDLNGNRRFLLFMNMTADWCLLYFKTFKKVTETHFKY